jgi:hypothetical protein
MDVVNNNYKSVFLEKLKKYILKRFTQYKPEEPFAKRASEYRTYLQENLSSHTSASELLQFFDESIWEHMAAYLSALQLQETGEALLHSLYEFYLIGNSRANEYINEII